MKDSIYSQEADPHERKKSLVSNPLVLQVALVVALAIMGDSLMYSLLPLEAENLGIPLSLVGLLLSANRIIRLFSNSWSAKAFIRWGPKIPFVFAAVLGVIATFIYGSGLGFFVFLLARAGWGIAWSVFRQAGYQAVWNYKEEVKGRMMGILWGTIRLGSAVSVLMGGFLYDRIGYAKTVMVIGAIAFFAIPTSLKISWKEKTTLVEKSSNPQKIWDFIAGLSNQRIIFIVGFLNTLFESILVSTVSIYLASRFQTQLLNSLIGIGSLAGILLAVRFSANIIFAPLIGSISDKVGQEKTLVILTGVIAVGIIGLVAVPTLWAIVFIPIIFIAGSGAYTTVSASSSSLANQSKSPHRFVGVFSTSIDLGAAAGPLTAFSIGAVIGYERLYLISALLFFLYSIIYYRNFKARGK